MFVPDTDEYKNLEEFRQLREQYVRDGITCTHWPLELIGASMYYKQNLLKKNLDIIGRGLRDENTPLKLNSFQHSLIIGTNVEAENETAEIVF
jgi:hypothetical protein